MIYYIAAAIVYSVLVRWLVAMHPHSGQGKEPMFGDFEAQRHWMEITNNLPVTEWYKNTTDNDLMYWGLDYPVLTAYHSYVMGLLGKLVNPVWMELHKSRGMEHYEFKMFMRTTVLMADFFIFFPASYLLFHFVSKLYSTKQFSYGGFALVVTCPTLVLIDHGHFQYNCVSLGLAIGAIYCLIKVQINDEEFEYNLPDSGYLIGSILYVLALTYKQMELYHALPIFCYLFGRCFFQKRFLSGLMLFSNLGLTVIVTFITVMLPFLIPSHLPALDVFNRMFPVNRGLYEDKVASFWCVISVIWKFSSKFSLSAQLMMCSVSCLISFAPAGYLLFRNPNSAALIPGITISSLCFFLFSYHVHEKSILLAAVPAVFLVGVAPVEVIWFQCVSTVSMLPLLMKDGLLTACVGSSLTWLAACALYLNSRPEKVVGEKFYPFIYLLLRPYLIFLSVVVCSAISICLATGWPQPPMKLPYLYELLVAISSFTHFFMFLCLNYCLLIGFTMSKPKAVTGAKEKAIN